MSYVCPSCHCAHDTFEAAASCHDMAFVLCPLSELPATAHLGEGSEGYRYSTAFSGRHALVKNGTPANEPARVYALPPLMDKVVSDLLASAVPAQATPEPPLSVEATDALQRLYLAAHHWWGKRRPQGWDTGAHLSCPVMNTTNPAEHALACAVANVLKSGFRVELPKRGRRHRSVARSRAPLDVVLASGLAPASKSSPPLVLPPLRRGRKGVGLLQNEPCPGGPTPRVREVPPLTDALHMGSPLLEPVKAESTGMGVLARAAFFGDGPPEVRGPGHPRALRC